MPLQATSGAASYDAFGGGVAAVPNYIEDVFSTWLYTGNGSTQTITNGIDLAGKGGLVWCKDRTIGLNHALFDTARGVGQMLQTDNTGSQSLQSTAVNAFNSNGFTTGSNVYTNNNNTPYTSWTLREQPKFFDVVTWTGDGVAGRQISHALGSAPGAIIVKCTSIARDWAVWQNTLSDGTYLKLNTTESVITNTSFQVFGDASGQTSTYFTVGKSGAGVNGLTNANGDTYVAYLFAHNAGGFGLTGTDNVISCGLTTANGSGDFSVNLGYEPQWILIKSTGAGLWSMVDNMRGATASSGYTSSKRLQANSSAAEDQLDNPYGIGFNATGFTGNLATFSNDFIYIAIRRGPMKVPTTGTSVFSPVAYTEILPLGTQLTAPFPTDLNLTARRSSATGFYWVDRLRGSTTSNNAILTSFDTAAEFPLGVTTFAFDNNTGVKVNYLFNNTAGATDIDYQFQRAPVFFDEVCYTGDLTARTLAHNLTVAPEMMIVKSRSATGNWQVFHKDLNALGTETADDSRIRLNSDAAATANNVIWNSTLPTAAVFSVGASSDSNASGTTYVNYLFATCPGVSKVGSFTGTGATQTINCGFTGGARFVLIKSTSASGAWYVWDSARGIVAGNDPYLLLNSTAAEVTTTDWVDTAATGFELSNAGGNLANSSGVSYIFLAIS